MVEENDSYTVGYGKPPKHTRFKPGRSGNPRGRPRKRTATFDDDVEVELRSTILITENGKSRRITKRRAIAKQHVLKAIKGDHQSTELLLKSGGQTGLTDKTIWALYWRSSREKSQPTSQ